MAFEWMPSAAVASIFNVKWKVQPWFQEWETLSPYCENGMLFNASDYWLASANDIKPKDLLRLPTGKQLVVDSGGWAIKNETRGHERLTAEYVINLQLKCGNVGLALDPAPRFDRDLGNRLEMRLRAEKQGQNNLVFLRERQAAGREGGEDPLVLLNCAHGGTSKEFEDWIARVKMEGFQGWAIANDSRIDPVCIYRGVATLYHQHPESRTQWLHLFKESSNAAIPAMAWLSRYFSTLTSDSTSWLRQHGQPPQWKWVVPPGARCADAKWAGFSPQAFADGVLIPCECAVCTELKEFRNLYMYGSKPPYLKEGVERNYVLGVHNLLAIKRVVAFWNTLATEINEFEEYKERVDFELKDFARKNEALYRLTYLETALQEGVEAADRVPRR